MPPHGRALPIVAGLAVVPPGFGATASGGDIILGIRLGERNGAPLLDIVDAREQALEAGADAFLQKPLDPLRLVSAVKDLLGTSAYLATPARSPV